MADNTLLFPLGLTRHLTPADSLMPGDLLARSVPDGHALAVAMVVAAGVAVTAWLIRRPPRDLRDATWRLALGLALLFALGPAERFGYFIYPVALVGWLYLTKRPRDDPAAPHPASP
jgi:phosphatidylinositol alpha-1,6-mannosyltransferase